MVLIYGFVLLRMIPHLCLDTLSLERRRIVLHHHNSPAKVLLRHRLGRRVNSRGETGDNASALSLRSRFMGLLSHVLEFLKTTL